MGKHYLCFIRDQNAKETWTLYNDSRYEPGMTWTEVVSYCIDTKCIPTVLIFEKSQTSQGNQYPKPMTIPFDVR